jgi:hypothetical protein
MLIAVGETDSELRIGDIACRVIIIIYLTSSVIFHSTFMLSLYGLEKREFCFEIFQSKILLLGPMHPTFVFGRRRAHESLQLSVFLVASLKSFQAIFESVTVFFLIINSQALILSRRCFESTLVPSAVNAEKLPLLEFGNVYMAQHIPCILLSLISNAKCI